MQRFFIFRLFAIIALSISCACVSAQTWPSKPVRIVLQFPPGGATDVVARILAQHLTGSLGQTVIVENKPGADGQIAAEYVMRAEPDGHTFFMASNTPMMQVPLLKKNPPYDPLTSFSPVALVGRYIYVMVANSKLPFKTYPELIAYGKANPGKLNFGSGGTGTTPHLAGEMFNLAAGMRVTHVPYKGSAPALVDLLGGQLAFTFDTVLTASPLIQDKRLKAFAVSGPKRARSLPTIPTMQEEGFKGFDITQFVGLFAPAGTDAAIIERLNQSTRLALQDAEVIETLQTKGGNDLVGNSAAEFAALIKRELTMYGTLVKQAEIKAE